ncbi:UPF0705 protein C11orf49-like protein [Plecturocebus cupreus]
MAQLQRHHALSPEAGVGLSWQRREDTEKGQNVSSLPELSPTPTVPEFLDSVAAIYQDLLSGKNPNTVIVPTSSGQHRQRPALGEASMLEGVEASLFCQCLENLCDRHKYR